MSGSLGKGMKIVARMTPMRDDGTLAAVAFVCFEGEDEDEAEGFEVMKDARGQVRLVPGGIGKLRDWRKVAVMAAEGG